MTGKKAQVIGGGLAGSEAAWQLAEAGIEVTLHEMRPVRKTDVHQTHGLAELVCSNSFRSDDKTANAVGVLHEEMRMMNSLIMREADIHAVPAGGALAVDRDNFSAGVEQALENHDLVTINRDEITELPSPSDGPVIIASGPLTSDSLANSILAETKEDDLAFFDAIAPIVHFDSINMDIAWFQSRYDKGTGKDYINCPMNEDQYNAFITALCEGEKMSFKEFEENTPYFDGCMPIEIMAERGPQTLRFGPMKPVGLTNAHDGSRPFAVVQLRQDNELATLFNMVGFQTKMKYGEQVRVFRTIPGLENAELRLKTQPHIRFAGQITGVEGYVESAATGGMAGRMLACELHEQTWQSPPQTTAHGALLSHITGGAMADTFQPMNVNFGLFPAMETKKRLKGRDRKHAYAERALNDMQQWLA